LLKGTIFIVFDLEFTKKTAIFESVDYL